VLGSRDHLGQLEHQVVLELQALKEPLVPLVPQVLQELTARQVHLVAREPSEQRVQQDRWDALEQPVQQVVVEQQEYLVDQDFRVTQDHPGHLEGRA